MVVIRKRKPGGEVVQKEIARRRSKIVERTPSLVARGSRNYKAQRIVYGILIVVIVVIAIYILLFSGSFRVERAVVVGSENISDERIDEIVFEESEGLLWGFLPRSNIFVLNTRKTETQLLEDIAQIRSVEIKRQLPNILKVYIEERDPVIIWETDGRQYYLDVDGVISKDIDGSSALQLPVIKDLSDKQVVPREQIVSENFVEFVGELTDSFHQETGLDIGELLTPSPLSREVHVQTSEDWLIYFTSARTLSSQYQKLLLILNKELSPEQRSNLEYIDLRIKDKIYYK
ncbi:cell division protein FtsQ/DivIB [Patescibacteria group bacterium]